MASQRPPTAPNINDIFNRINMGMQQQAKILSTLGTSSSNNNTNTNKHTNKNSNSETTKSKGGFSALSKHTSTTTSSSSSPQDNAHPAQDNSDLDLNPSYLQPPNIGIGFSTPSDRANARPNAADASNIALKAKLSRVGFKTSNNKNRNGSSNTTRKRTAAAADSESEEELGRSAVGKSKSKSKSRPQPTSNSPDVKRLRSSGDDAA